jgi:hypothetical protein
MDVRWQHESLDAANPIAMAENHVTDRALLHFADEVKARFGFLETFGFRCARSEATLVRFESPKLAVSIFHGRQSYEISLEIENAQGSETHSFSEILRFVHNERAEQYRDYATHTVEGVAEGVRQLAELFQKCVNAGILGDSELFSRLKLQREEWARNYALETQLEQVRKKSESAWAEKNFEKVVQVLAPLQEHLNPSDLKKLEYAKKHSNAAS